MDREVQKRQLVARYYPDGTRRRQNDDDRVAVERLPAVVAFDNDPGADRIPEVFVLAIWDVECRAVWGLRGPGEPVIPTLICSCV